MPVFCRINNKEQKGFFLIFALSILLEPLQILTLYSYSWFLAERVSCYVTSYPTPPRTIGHLWALQATAVFPPVPVCRQRMMCWYYFACYNFLKQTYPWCRHWSILLPLCIAACVACLPQNICTWDLLPCTVYLLHPGSCEPLKLQVR